MEQLNEPISRIFYGIWLLSQANKITQAQKLKLKGLIMQELVIRKNPEILTLAQIYLETNKLEKIEESMIQLSNSYPNSIFFDLDLNPKNKNFINKASNLDQLSSPIDSALLERKSNIKEMNTSHFLLKRANEN